MVFRWKNHCKPPAFACTTQLIWCSILPLNVPNKAEVGSSPHPSSESDSLQLFVRDASPASWLEYAEELRDAAELLWSHSSDCLRVATMLDAQFVPESAFRVSSISRTYTLLAGFALENAIKGILVALDPTRVNTGNLSRDLKSHNLQSLAAKIPGLTLSDQEQKFCESAAAAIPYWGRYPIPLEKGGLSIEIGVDEQVRMTFLGLFDRLAHQLYWAVRDGWDSGVGPQTLKVRSNKYGDKIDPGESLI